MHRRSITLLNGVPVVRGSDLSITDLLMIYGFSKERAMEISQRFRPEKVHPHHIPALTVALLKDGDLALYEVGEEEHSLMIFAAKDMQRDDIQVMKIVWGSTEKTDILFLPPQRRSISIWNGVDEKIHTEARKPLSVYRTLHQMEEEILNRWLSEDRDRGMILHVERELLELIEYIYSELIPYINKEIMLRMLKGRAREIIQQTKIDPANSLRWFHDPKISAMYFILLFLLAVPERARTGLVMSMLVQSGTQEWSALSSLLQETKQAWEELTGTKLIP